MDIRIRLSLDQLKIVAESLLLNDMSKGAKLLGESFSKLYTNLRNEEAKAKREALQKECAESQRKVCKIFEELFGGAKR